MNELPFNPPVGSFGNLSILEHLVVSYKAWEETVRRLQKDLRYTLGAKITKTYIELLERIFLASITSGAQKLPVLQSAGIKLELLKFFMRIAWESKAIDTQKYGALGTQLARIGRELGGWRKDTTAKMTKTKPAP
jgi:hypothetical protein